MNKKGMCIVLLTLGIVVSVAYARYGRRTDVFVSVPHPFAGYAGQIGSSFGSEPSPSAIDIGADSTSLLDAKNH